MGVLSRDWSTVAAECCIRGAVEGEFRVAAILNAERQALGCGGNISDGGAERPEQDGAAVCPLPARYLHLDAGGVNVIRRNLHASFQPPTIDEKLLHPTAFPME